MGARRICRPCRYNTPISPYGAATGWRQARAPGSWPIGASGSAARTSCCNLPTDRPRPAEQSYRGANLRFDLDPALTERLRALAAERGVTLPMLLLASFDVLVHRYTQQTDVRVGITIANRNHVETEGLIGFFVNMLVLRADLGGRSDLRGRAEPREGGGAGRAGASGPAVRAIGGGAAPERSLGHNPLFQIAYDHQWKRLDRLDDLSGLAIEPFEHEMCATQFDLLLHTVRDRRAPVRHLHL